MSAYSPRQRCNAPARCSPVRAEVTSPRRRNSRAASATLFVPRASSSAISRDDNGAAAVARTAATRRSADVSARKSSRGGSPARLRCSLSIRNRSASRSPAVSAHRPDGSRGRWPRRCRTAPASADVVMRGETTPKPLSDRSADACSPTTSLGSLRPAPAPRQA